MSSNSVRCVKVMYISSGNAQVVSFQVNILLVVLVQLFLGFPRGKGGNGKC